MDMEQLKARFPQMRPLNGGAPTLVSINGIGLTIYGARDHDAESATFVKTRCLAIFFVPIFALDAFRVSKAVHGWYFLGKEPLSAVAKTWNAMLALLIVAAIAVPQWEAYTTSPDYLAKQELDRAQTELAEGKLTQATHHFATVAEGGTESAPNAQTALSEIVTQRLRQAPVDDAIDALATIVKIRKSLRHAIAEDPALVAFGQELIARKDDPRHGLAALEAIAPLIKPEEKTALKEPLLVALVAKEPTNPQPASALAEIYDERGEADRCEALLSPLRAQLGTREGARILGRIDAAKGRNDESYQLLFPYCRERLKTLQSLEQRYKTQEDRAWKAAYAALNDGAAGDPWYAQYEKMDKDHKQEAVDTWAQERVKHDTAFTAAQEALRQAATVVPVALDLGVVTLQRAQTIADPTARKAELEAAEKTFIAIKGLAGESDDYHLSFGQVCYWLGKNDDAKKEFDALLIKHKRANAMLLSVAQIMREVGNMDEARKLTEEAYTKAKDDDERHTAARMRALSHKDNDDSLLWLERSDQGNPWVMCNLNYTRGNKAINEGDYPKAITALRACIAGYEAMPKSTGSLNNGALASHSLFEVTGALSDLERGNHWLEEAIALEPSDSILMENLADHLIQAGVMEVIGTRIDQVALRKTGDIDLLYHLYLDAAGKAAVVAQLNANPTLTRALAYYDKLLVLAPKNPGLYSTLRTIYRFTDHTAALRTLHQRLLAAQLDPLRDRQERIDSLAGKYDERIRTRGQTRSRFLEGLLASKDLSHPSLTGAVVLTELISNRMGAIYFGDPIDGDALIALAEQADTEGPSSDSRGMLITTLISRALRRVAAATPALATLLSELRRTQSDTTLAILACSDPQFGPALGSDPALQRAITLIKEQLVALPHYPSSGYWAMLKALNDPAAATFAEALRQDEAGTIALRVDLDLNPLRPGNVIDLWWRLRSLGDDAGAAAILTAAHQREVALPELVH